MFNPSSLDDYKSAAKYLPRQSTMRRWRGRDFESDILDILEGDSLKVVMDRFAGPLPLGGDGYNAALELIEKSITPILKLREVSQRHVRGVIGYEPQFEFVAGDIAPKKERRKRQDYEKSRDDIETFADETDKVQGDVWNEEGEHKIVKKAVARLIATGSAYFRYDVPPGLLVEGVDRDTGEETQGLAADSWQDAYRQTYIELAPRGAASVYLDPYTRRKTAFYAYSEPVPGDETKTRKAIQISWVDIETGLTQVRVVRQGSDMDKWELDTGGIPLVVDAFTAPLLTPDLLKLQDIMCAIGTNVKINSDVAGHPQMTLVDMAQPAVEVPSPTEADPNAKKRVEVAVQTGPRTIQKLYSYVHKDKDGKIIVDQNGKPVIQQGKVEYREPVSSQPLRDDIDFFGLEIYSAVNQRHVPARTSANASAEMLVEMRADFALSLIETKPDIERPLRSIFKARLCMAAHIAGDAAALALFREGRVRVDMRLYAGPVSTAEAAEIRAQRSEGLMTDETAMVLLGKVDDVEAESVKLQEDRLNAEQGSGPTPARPKVATPTLQAVPNAA